MGSSMGSLQDADCFVLLWFYLESRDRCAKEVITKEEDYGVEMDE